VACNTPEIVSDPGIEFDEIAELPLCPIKNASAIF
jgi:hypothetical protein